MSEGQLHLLRLDMDQAARPWVARVLGTSVRFGLEREFVGSARDYSGARPSSRRPNRGVVLTFPLRVGWVVEVKEDHSRFFARVEADKLVEMSTEEVFAWAVERDEQQQQEWTQRLTVGR